jgi:hypothetical protein
MSKPKSFKENLVTWRTMANNLEPRLDDLPYLRDQHAASERLVEFGVPPRRRRGRRQGPKTTPTRPAAKAAAGGAAPPGKPPLVN